MAADASALLTSALPTSALPARIWRRAVLIAGICAVLLVVLYLSAVWTPAGQRFEDAVLRAAKGVADGTAGARATRTLDAITGPFLAASVLAVVAIGLLRRRPALGFVGAGVIAATVLTAEIVRRAALRPILLHSGYRRDDQSFPSGHCAVAMSVMCALVLVVPYRWRGAVAFAASLWAASVGVATVTASWHRPSDTLGSELIAALYACLAVAALAVTGSVRPAPGGTAASRVAGAVPRWVYGGAVLIAFVGASILGSAVIDHLGGVGSNLGGPGVLAAGRGLPLVGAVAIALTLLALLRRVDLVPPQKQDPVPPQKQPARLGDVQW